MKLLLLTYLLVCASIEVYSKAICQDEETKGYYWRDYTGVIPPDALLGGNINGTATYIGQALFTNRGMLIPGEINAETKTISFEYYDAAFTATEDIKILCSQHPDDFKWVEIDAKDSIYSVMDNAEDLIIGGREGSHIITIGKVFDDGNERIGKVIISNDNFDAMYFAEEGKRLFPRSFKVLVYKPMPCKDYKENVFSIINV